MHLFFVFYKSNWNTEMPLISVLQFQLLALIFSQFLVLILWKYQYHLLNNIYFLLLLFFIGKVVPSSGCFIFDTCLLIWKEVSLNNDMKCALPNTYNSFCIGRLMACAVQILSMNIHHWWWLLSDLWWVGYCSCHIHVIFPEQDGPSKVKLFFFFFFFFLLLHFVDRQVILIV